MAPGDRLPRRRHPVDVDARDPSRSATRAHRRHARSPAGARLLDQATDLDILFATLFPAGADQELSPLHRKALRIAADLVDEHPGFVNHGEIFRKHALPWDSFRLRELARAGIA
ncbi:hypothetical protein [Nannocystis pusilla]|uniref:hypothetical protein n=1 Tax=Nannocystis pusilla TaxID=889268 RepID=UPI003B7CC40F